MFLLEITDNATARAITLGASFVGTNNNSISGLTTAISKKLMLYFKWSATLAKFELIHLDQSL